MTIPVGSLAAYLSVRGAAQANADILSVQRNLQSAGAAGDKAGVGIGRTEAALSATGKSAANASAGANKFRASQLSLLAATERYNAVLADEDATVRQLATAEAALIRANERVNASRPVLAPVTKQADEAAVATSKFGSSVRDTAGMLGTLGVGLGVFELVKQAIDIGKSAVSFQKNMLLIQTQAGASAGSIKGLSSAVLAMSGQVAQSPDDLATSLYHVYSVGLKGAKALDVVRVAAEGARVGNADLEETTNALTATVASGIGGVTSMSQAMGVLNSIVGAGDMKLSDLNDALGGGILTIAKTFGVNITEVGAALATFGDNNIRGADAATKLRMSIQDIAKPAAGADAVLSQIHLTAADLSGALSQHGLTGAIDLLRTHMAAAGITGSKVGGFIESAFTKRAGAGLAILIEQANRFHVKLDEIGQGGSTFAQRWDATTKTAAFALAALGDKAKAAGITIAENITPALSKVATLIATAIPAALHIGGAALTPFVAAWHELEKVLGPVGDAIGHVASFLGPIAPVASAVAAAVGSMWLAFKGYQIARAAVFGIADATAAMGARVKNSFADMRVSMDSTASLSKMTATQFEADMLAEQTAALQTAAVNDRAAAMQAQAFADETAASSASTDAQVKDADERAAAALAAARTSATAASASAEASEEASATIVASGDAAKLGWAGLAGPLGLAAIGVLTLVSLFHKSDTASKEAANAAKAYTDALHADSGGGSSVVDAIIKQLQDNGVAQELQTIDASLKGTALSGKQFVDAISSGGKPLDDLRARLEGVIKAGTSTSQVMTRVGTRGITTLTPAAQAAQDALGHLNTQYNTLSEQTRKDLVNTKAFYGAAGAIDTTAQAAKLGSATAATYAGMLGLVGDKSGVVAGVTQHQLNAAVATVSSAFTRATQTGSDFLAALQTFSTSAGTSADRAALIGATLKANAGDALNFATQMNTAATSVAQLGTDIASSAKGVGKSGETTKAYLDGIVNLKKGTIDYSKTAAAPLISNLGSIQSAAIAAAQATYQHNLSFEKAGPAADDAIAGYKGVESSLTSQLVKLGLSSSAAEDLTRKILGVPKNVKTLIEQEGADPVLTVLNKIGALLAHLAGEPWTLNVGVNTASANAALAALEARLRADGLGGGAASQVAKNASPFGAAGRARGTIIQGPGSGTSDTAGVYALSNGEAVIPAKATAAHMPLVQALINEGRGMAAGGLIHGVYRVGKGYGYQGQYYSTAKDANAAFNSAVKNYEAQQVLAQGSYGPIGTSKGKASAVGQMIRSQIPYAKTAMADMAKAVDEAWQLSKTKASIAAVKTQLTSLKTQLSTMRQYRSGVESTLQGQFDPTQYGSISSLAGGVKGATAQDNKFAAEVNKLRSEAGGNKALLGFVNEQAAKGSSPLLDMLASASKSSLTGLAGSLGAYDKSLLAGGNAATTLNFGKSVTQQVAAINKLTATSARLTATSERQMHVIEALANAVTRDSGKPLVVELDGEVIYRGTTKRAAAKLHAKAGR